MLGSGLPLKTIITKTKASQVKAQTSKKMREQSKSAKKEEDLNNNTMLGMMRDAFHKEVELSHLYRQLPIRKDLKNKY